MTSSGGEIRHCTSLLEEEFCPMANDCETGNWGPWSLCSEGDHPRKNRTREIKLYAMNGGKECCQQGM